MLLIKSAFKNIIGNGKRTWLNVAVLSFTFVLILAFNGIIDGWLDESRRNTKAWETGDGQLWHPEYDKYDIFTLQDAHGVVPSSLNPYIEEQTLTPILVTQGVAYPQGRMQNVLLKGIDPNQQVLAIPTQKLLNNGNDITAIIGTRMAKAVRLGVGDKIMVRWRDSNGAFDAQEILIVDIFDNKVPSTDAGQIWLNLSKLQEITSMSNEATYLVKSKACPIQKDVDEWHYKNLKFLLADIDAMEQASRVESVIIFIILIAIALLAVFDTQTLSIFRRQKEIGTYVALGMTPRKVVRLFTYEGTSYSILAIVAGVIWGSPFLIWLAKKGMKMPDMVEDMGIAIGDVIYATYKPSSVLISIIILVVLSALISYLPARKIAKQNVVDALKGKIN